jgi:hypothetical protein
MRTIALALLLASSLALAGCSGKSSSDGSAATGSFELAFADNLASGRLELRGAYLHAPNGWVQALGNGTVYDLKGAGGNLTQSGELRAGDYDRLQVNFASFSADGRSALLTQTGIDIAVNITVPEGGTTQVGLVISWVESLYESEKGLAFAPVLTRLTVHVDGVETLRLQANEITSGSGKMPVARMRIFDSTGLEAFVSTFVADNPEKPVIGTAGNITLSATASEAVQKDATLVSYECRGLHPAPHPSGIEATPGMDHPAGGAVTGEQRRQTPRDRVLAAVHALAGRHRVADHDDPVPDRSVADDARGSGCLRQPGNGAPDTSALDHEHGKRHHGQHGRRQIG